MKILLIFTFCLIRAGTDAVNTVTGYRGRSVQINCSYDSGYEENLKYLCTGECPYVGKRNVPVQSGSPAKDSRFSLYDDTTAKVFNVTITDLRPEDEGTYWCGIERTLVDVYTEIQLLVKMDDPVFSTVSQSTHITHPTSGHITTSPVHADSTHPTAGTPLNEVNNQTIASSSNYTFSISGYIIIGTSAMLLTVAVIIAIYYKANCQGSQTVTKSSRETNGDHENDHNLPDLQATVQNEFT